MDILPSLLESDTLYLISLTLLHFIWQGTVIAGLLFCLNKLTSNKHSQFRYIFSLFCLLLCVIAPTITFYILSQADEMISMGTLATNDVISSSLASSNTYHTSQELQLADFTPLIAVLWMSGITLLSIRLTLQMLQVHRLTTTNIVQPSDKLELVFNQLKERLVITKRARLVISLTAHVPMAIGWIKPVVLLPANLASGLSIAQLEMLMAHELAHIKRHDYLINLIQTFVELILFFHPAVKWISKQIRQEREYCCDDLAIHHCGNHLVYARALAEAEVLRHNIPELAMAATGGDLSSRIHRAVGQHSCAPRYGNQWLAALAAAFVIPSIFTASKVIAMTQSEPAPVPPVNQQNVMVLDAKLDENKTPQKPIEQQANQQQTSKTVKKAIAANAKQPPVSTIVATKANKQVHAQVAKAISKVEHEPQTTLQVDSRLETRDTKTHGISETKEEQQKMVIKQSQPNAKPVTLAKAQITKAAESTKVKTQLISEPNNNQGATKAATPPIKATAVTQTEEVKKLTTAPAVKTQPQKSKDVLAPKFTNAKLIHSVIPEYPRVYYSRKGQIDIPVTFTVNTNGKIVDIDFKGDVSVRFTRSIKHALKKWRFEPAQLGDKKVPIEMSKIFSFGEPSQYLRPVTGSRIAARLK